MIPFPEPSSTKVSDQWHKIETLKLTLHVGRGLLALRSQMIMNLKTDTSTRVCGLHEYRSFQAQLENTYSTHLENIRV